MPAEREPIHPVNPHRDTKIPRNVRIHFIFGEHQFKRDWGDPKLRRRQMIEADVFVPEAPGVDRGKMSLLTDISHGDRLKYTALRLFLMIKPQTGSEFVAAQFKSVYKSGTEIGHIDTEKKDKHINDELDQLEEGWLRHELPAELSEEVVLYGEFNQALTENGLKRERVIMRNLAHLARKVGHQEGGGQILIQLGGNHSALFQSLRKSNGPNITRETLPQHRTYPFESQVAAMMKHGTFQQQHPERQEELLMKAYTEEMVIGRSLYIPKRDLDIEASRNFINALSAEQMQELYSAYREGDGHKHPLIKQYKRECTFRPWQTKKRFAGAKEKSSGH